jgi:hypothetical protein
MDRSTSGTRDTARHREGPATPTPCRGGGLPVLLITIEQVAVRLFGDVHHGSSAGSNRQKIWRLVPGTSSARRIGIRCHRGGATAEELTGPLARGAAAAGD